MNKAWKKACVPLFALLVLMTSCASTGGSGGITDQDLECICGTMEAALQGCQHAACRDGRGNPDNPRCACGPLFAEGAVITTVGTGEGSYNTALGKTQYLILKGGRQARGVLISDDGISIQVRAQNGNVRTYAYGALDPRSIYRLMKAKTRPDDGSGRLVLANYARDNGMYAHARRHYKEALKADGSQVTAIEASLTTLRSLASNELLTEGREKLEKGDHRGAEKDLTAVINEFPLERAAETAAGLLADIDARQQEEYTRSVRDRSEAVAKALAAARKDYDKMVEKNREGLMNVRSQTRAIRSYESAIKDGEKALKKIASVRKKNGDEPQYAAACEELDALVIEQVVQTSINLASAEMVRSSYNNALKSINVALGHAPKHAEAKAMRARIEDAAAESSGWGWGWRLGRAGGIR